MIDIKKPAQLLAGAKTVLLHDYSCFNFYNTNDDNRAENRKKKIRPKSEAFLTLRPSGQNRKTFIKKNRK